MHMARLSPVAVALLVLGCASQSPRKISVAPSPDELPNLPLKSESHVQAAVQAERDTDQPRVVLVPRFEEPALTPEEKEATDQLDPPYKLLPHELRRKRAGQAVGTWGGPEVASVAVTRNIGREPAQRNIAAGDVGGPAIAIDQFITRVLGHHPAERTVSAGPEQSPAVGIGGRREPARAHTKHGQ